MTLATFVPLAAAALVYRKTRRKSADREQARREHLNLSRWTEATTSSWVTSAQSKADHQRKSIRRPA
jgi:hypothetical protein